MTPRPPRTASSSPDHARAELARAVHAAEPGAFLVPARILRRVIREKVELRGLTITLPHRKTFVLPRDETLKIVERSELGLSSRQDPPDPVMLVSEPSDEALEYLPFPEILRRAWRLTYHAKIHAVFAGEIAKGRWPVRAIRARIDRIGQTAFDEIRAVLRQEDLLVPPDTDRSVYGEFAAFFLDLFAFAPHLLPHYFPGLADFERVRAILLEDFDADGLLAATRPEGAPEPDAIDFTPEERRWEQAEADATAEPAPRPSVRRHRVLRDRAERAAASGNCVRAAILFQRAARRAPTGDGEDERGRAAAELDRLLERLRRALDLGPGDLPAWREGLEATLRRTGVKVWSRAVRMLYDLQKVCVDHERGVFTIDPVEWILTFGRRPIRRWLPSEREVLENRHLRSARRRLNALRLPPEVHARFQPALQRAVEAAEHRLRETFRPRIPAVFREVGLNPRNLPERVALDKLTEELLDEVVARGRLGVGDLRDAISRNQLKLPDIRNPLSVWNRDPLLMADRKLSVTMDGVYRRAEFYIRWLQRISALALGTVLGRILVKFVVIPFGGAFVALEGIQHLTNPVLVHVFGGEEIHLTSLPRAIVVGIFLLGLIHVPWFRKQVWEGMRFVFRALRFLFGTIPGWIVRLPVVARLMESRPFLLAMRFLLKPALYTAALLGLLRLAGSWQPGSFRETAAVFLGVSFLVNLPAGRRLEEITYDRLARNLHRFRVRVLSGLYQMVMGFFRGFLDQIDRLLYSVDEWLRFRSGEGRLSLVLKPVAGLVWFAVSYIVRIYTTLLIEPQVNPIKHFPVVTVAHKVTLPFAPSLTKLFATPLHPLGPVVANSIAVTTVLLMPGIFGFLVWELKENWKLFEKNRPKKLKPVRLGHHGETMLRLMKPGLHSGTLPKLYARLRRAERKAWQSDSERKIRKYVNDLHHVEDALRHFIARDFLPLLAASAEGRWRVGKIRMGSNALRIEVLRDGAEAPMVLAFDEQSGWLVAALPSPGWVEDLSREERERVRNALVGLYKRAGAEIVREQVVAALGEEGVAWDIADRGLVVWPEESWETEVVYPLEGPSLLFSETPLTWREWVSAWEDPAAGPPLPLLPRVRLIVGEPEFSRPAGGGRDTGGSTS